MFYTSADWNEDSSQNEEFKSRKFIENFVKRLSQCQYSIIFNIYVGEGRDFIE